MAALAFTPLAATAQEAPTWSQFQGGPGHPGVLVDGPQPPYRVRWTLPAPAGEALSGAVVAGDLAVSVGAEAVYGIDVASGTVEWQVRRDGGPLSVPAIGAGPGGRILVYLEGPGPNDAGGTTEGSPSLSASATPSVSPSAIRSTPTAATGPSATGPAEQADSSTLVAISLADQSEVWRTPLGATSRSGVTIDGTNAFVGDQDGSVYAVSLETGAISWSEQMGGRVDSADRRLRRTGGRDRPEHRHGAGRRGRVRRGDGGAVVAGARDPGELHGRDRAVGGRWFALHRFGATGACEPSTPRTGPSDGLTLALSLFSPATALAFDDQSVFAADIAGGLYRLDAADGGRAWSYHLNEVVLRSSPVVSGDSVLLGLGDGRLIAIDVASGHLVWQSAPSPGLVGTIALASDAVIAVKGGRDAGLIAFEHDPDGVLIDVPSPTQLDTGTTLTRWALAAVIVFVVAFVPGLWAKRRFGVAAQGEADGEVSDPDAETEEGP